MMDITKRGTPVRHVDLDVVLEQEKQLLVLPQPIVYVPQIRAVVPMVPLLLELVAQRIMPTFATSVPMATTSVLKTG